MLKHQKESLSFQEGREFDLHLRKLVYSIIARITVPASPLCGVEDLVQNGIYGALEAARDFTPGRATFVSYAYGRIRGSIIDYLRKIDMLPREKRRDLAVFLKAMEDDEVEHGVASWSRVLESLGWSDKRFRNVCHSIEVRKSLGLYAAKNPAAIDGSVPTWLDSIDSNSDSPDANCDMMLLEKAIDMLSERSATVVRMYFLEEKTLREIGEHFGFTEANASFVRSKAIRKLQQHVS